jgi:uncharacterized protein YneF (UPF0154 family)
MVMTSLLIVLAVLLAGILIGFGIAKYVENKNKKTLGL